MIDYQKQEKAEETLDKLVLPKFTARNSQPILRFFHDFNRQKNDVSQNVFEKNKYNTEKIVFFLQKVSQAECASSADSSNGGSRLCVLRSVQKWIGVYLIDHWLDLW